MDSQAQCRQILSMVYRHPCPHLSGWRLDFESRRPALAKPGYRLAGGGEPSAPTLEPVNQITVRATPQPLWRQAAIVPIHRQDTAEVADVVFHFAESGLSFSGGEVEISSIKQRRVHDVQREFEQLTRAKRPIDLSGAGSVSHGVVKADGRVVSGPGLFKIRG